MILHGKAIPLVVLILSFAVFSLARSRLVSLGAEGPAQARFLTGDEPAYMLLAHSLVTDGDFNLYNNRVNKDGRAFGMERCDEHGARKDWVKKEIYSIHTPCLAVLIAPAYALGLHGPIAPRTAVCLFMNLLAAILAVNVYLFCVEIAGGARLPALLATATVALTPPVIFYSNLVYPELPAALLIVYALRHTMPTFCRLADSPSRRFAVSCAIAALPWLSFRFFLPALILLWLLVQSSRRLSPPHRRGVSLPLLLFTVSLASFLGYQWRAFGTINPAAGYVYQDFARRGFFSRGMLDGMFGILLDEGHGILTWSPVYMLSLTGLLLLFRQRRECGFWFLLLLLVIYLPGANFVFWWGVFAPPPRYMVVPAPLLGALLCYALSRRPRTSFIALYGLLLAASLSFCYAGCRHPNLLYKQRHIVTNHHPRLMTRAFPSFVHSRPSTWPLALGWGSLILAVNGFFFLCWGKPGRFHTGLITNKLHAGRSL